MSDDDAKRAVLARRARFVAAAMAGIASASCDSCAQPCLSATPVYADASPPPGPCLSIAYRPIDAGEQIAIDDAGVPGDAGNASDAGKDAGKKVVVGPPAPPPMPCLSPPRPPPRACLTPPF